MMKTGFRALWNYTGMIYDMGLEEDDLKRPSFYILTENMEHIQVSIDNGYNIAMVRDWLDNLNTEIPCDFENYMQFNKLIQDVFKVYGSRIGKFLNYDNSSLKLMKNRLGVSDKTIALKAGVGKSTVNDLVRGITKHPNYYTVHRIHSVLYRLVKEQNTSSK